MHLFSSSPCRARNFIVLFTLSLGLQLPAITQKVLPVIKANSAKADIKDGEIYQKAEWNLSPATRPDIYYSLEPAKQNQITFYTDIDSISFNTLPGKTYDFIILLGGKDSCYTRISTIPAPKAVQAPLLITTMISAELLKDDFISFRQALEKEHGGLYRYKTRATVDRLFDSCYASIRGPMTQLDFGKCILFLISSIQDGHTGTDITRLLVSQYSANEKMFPFFLYYIGDKAFILCSNIKELPSGTEILSIDGQKMGHIKKELMHYLPSDGSITSKKTQVLNNGAFPFLYRWIFGKKASFVINYRSTDNSIQTMELAAMKIPEGECTAGKPASNTPNLHLQYPEKRVALLTIKTFDEGRLGGRNVLKRFLDTSFTEINSKRIRTLIIDLRGNGGGRDEYGALLYQYLTTRPFSYYSSIGCTSCDINPEENLLMGIQQPGKINFTGRVLFLINGLSFSTTAEFCAIAKSNNRGLFIGEETGGGYYGNTSGKTINKKLPNTSINITIPKFKYVNDVKKTRYPDRGIIPDYPVQASIDEVLQNKDVQMKKALQLAGK